MCSTCIATAVDNYESEDGFGSEDQEDAASLMLLNYEVDCDGEQAALCVKCICLVSESTPCTSIDNALQGTCNSNLLECTEYLSCEKTRLALDDADAERSDVVDLVPNRLLREGILQAVRRERTCGEFGTFEDGACRYGDGNHERESVIRCSGDSEQKDFQEWMKRARKRKGKNHEFVENVTWVEYFKHEYSQNYGIRPAEGPSGFGAMYVPGETKACEKVRDTLNGLFDPPAWICSPVCKNKFNTKQKCSGRSRRQRRIRRLADNTAAERYILRHGSDLNTTMASGWHFNSSSYLQNSLVGDEWKEGFRELENSNLEGTDDGGWKNWRKETRVVGLDFSDCECQKYGDSHLTYGYVPDENGAPVWDPGASQSDRWNGTEVTRLPFTPVTVGAGETEHGISLQTITLKARATFSCNAITDNVSTFEDNSDAECMELCRGTVRTLRSLSAIMKMEESDVYKPFYFAAGLLVPFLLLCLCIISAFKSQASGSEDHYTCCEAEIPGWLRKPVVLTLKIFDWMSDWAFYAISLQHRRFTEFSKFGLYNENTFRGFQRTSLAFNVLGTLLVFIEFGISFLMTHPSTLEEQKKEMEGKRRDMKDESCAVDLPAAQLFNAGNHGPHQSTMEDKRRAVEDDINVLTNDINVLTNEIEDAYRIRWIVGLVVMALEDIPQLTLCSKYLNGMNADDGFQLSDDPLTGVSLIMSSLSLVYNIFSIVENVGQSHGVSPAQFLKEKGQDGVKKAKDRWSGTSFDNPHQYSNAGGFGNPMYSTEL